MVCHDNDGAICRNPLFVDSIDTKLNSHFGEQIFQKKFFTLTLCALIQIPYSLNRNQLSSEPGKPGDAR